MIKQFCFEVTLKEKRIQVNGNMFFLKTTFKYLKLSVVYNYSIFMFLKGLTYQMTGITKNLIMNLGRG